MCGLRIDQRMTLPIDVEDCPTISHEAIVAASDDSTLALVLELTNPSKGSLLCRRERKAMDREHIKHASNEAQIIKLIDRTDNLHELAADVYDQLAPHDFAALYAKESELLLHAIHAADEALATQLLCAIAKVYLMIDYP